MATQKTLATNANVDAYLQAIEDPARRADCIALAALMQEATMCEPRMWGTAIVGFGSYHYTYESGREGDACVVGFSSRRSEIAVYLAAEFASRESLLAELGSHKTGKACVYIKRLSDISVKVLAQLVRDGFAHTRARYPS